MNQITVKDVVLECGVNRNSFYYSFDDLPTLPEEVLKSEAESPAALPSVRRRTVCGPVIDFALRHCRAVMHTCNAFNRSVYERYLNRVSHDAVSEYVHSRFHGISADPMLSMNRLLPRIVLEQSGADFFRSGVRIRCTRHGVQESVLTARFQQLHQRFGLCRFQCHENRFRNIAKANPLLADRVGGFL